MHFSQILKATHFQINNSSPFTEKYFGGNEPVCIDIHNKEGEVVGEIITDRSEKVYAVLIEVQNHNIFYRWIDPDYYKDYTETLSAKGKNINEAWDGYTFTDIAVEADILIKLESICLSIPFDKYILVPIDISDAEFLVVAKMAHEYNLTFNEMTHKIVEDVVRQKSLKPNR